MKKEDFLYLNLILFHVGVGVVIYLLPFTSKLYGIVLFILSLFFIVQSKNRNNEALLAAGYLVGSEVLLRMTGGSLSYEFAKYGVVVLLFTGGVYNGFGKTAVPYWIFLLLLIPSVLIGTFVLNFDTNIRTTIAFNISGPVCLGLASLYTYRRKITLSQMNSLLLCIGLPIVSTTTYLALYTPSIREIVTGTGSNYATSGGFGPNQVATFLGLGMFIFFSRIIFESKSKFILALNLIIVFNISYRGMVTFSRGGMITGFLMIVSLLFFLYLKSNKGGKLKLIYIASIIGVAMTSIWLYTSIQTGGLINKRYANQDAAGREKASQFTGREEIAQSELTMFYNNPIFGVGVAKGVEIREENTGQFVVSHDEITRMLAEHGSLGALALLILIFTPLVLYFENTYNLFLFCFLVFWFLTINHAAMRTAVPAFVYSLSLLNLQMFDPKGKED